MRLLFTSCIEAFKALGESCEAATKSLKEFAGQMEKAKRQRYKELGSPRGRTELGYQVWTRTHYLSGERIRPQEKL